MSRYLIHLTLQTGHSRRSPRAEVADHVVTYCRELIDAALAQDGAQIAIQGLPAGWTLSARSAGRHALLATVWRDDQPMVTIGVATHSRAGAALWRLLIETAPTPGQPLDCPAEPWVVARLEPALVTASRDVIEALGDLERCLGWAWIER